MRLVASGPSGRDYRVDWYVLPCFEDDAGDAHKVERTFTGCIRNDSPRLTALWSCSCGRRGYLSVSTTGVNGWCAYAFESAAELATYRKQYREVGS